MNTLLAIALGLLVLIGIAVGLLIIVFIIMVVIRSYQAIRRILAEVNPDVTGGRDGKA